MGGITTKILKMIIFFGIFAWHIYSQFKKGGAIFSLEVIGAGLGLASLAYISLSLYGFIVDVSKRYLLAFIITIENLKWCRTTRYLYSLQAKAAGLRFGGY